MKKIIKKLSFILASSLILIGCTNDTIDSPAISNYSPVLIDLSMASMDVTVLETDGEQSFTVTATLQEPQTLDYLVKFEQSGGTANSDDFSVGRILISAGQTTGSTDIVIHQTGDIEGDETLSIVAKTFEDVAVLSNFMFNATITGDFVNNNLDVSLAWAGSYVYSINSLGAEVSIDYCDADFDLLLYDGVFNYLGYVLGTGSCPEPTESLSGLADGTYYLVADLWDNPFAPLGTGQPLPLTLTYSQDYFPMTSGTIINNGYTTDSSGGLVGIAKVELVNGYDYTVTPF